MESAEPRRLVVHKTIGIYTTPEHIWEAFTTPEMTRKFFFHASVSSSFAPGSPIAFTGRMFFIIPFEMKGTVIEAEKNKRLKYELGNSKSDSKSVVLLEIIPNGDNTILKISDNVGAGEGAQKRYERSVKGWDKVTAKLKKLLESAA